MSVPGASFRISDSKWCHRTPLCHIKLLNLDILQGSFRLCNWLSLRRLVSWINHLPPACWSTFWKSISKRQLGCRFDILDSISSFFLYFDICNHICLDRSYHFGFYPYFLDILYFFKYSYTNIFHRRSLCTFYRGTNTNSSNSWRHGTLLKHVRSWHPWPISTVFDGTKFTVNALTGKAGLAEM